MKSGIILANHIASDKSYDGVTYYSGQFPKIEVVLNPTSQLDLDQLIKRSQNKPVLIGIDAEDPIDLIFDIASLLEDPKLLQLFFKQLRVSGLHKRLRKVCKSCAQPMTVPEKVSQKLPACLRPKGELTTLKCSGCEECERSGFRGVVDIESVVAVNRDIRKRLLEGASPAQITELAYRQGTRSLLEDALEKNEQGLTNLLEVFQTVRKISTPFLAAIASRGENDSLDSPHDESLQSNLDASADDFFNATDPVEEEEGEEALPLPEISTEKASSDAQTILIVEDDKDQIDILAIVFQSEGYNVLTAENGKKALETLRNKPCNAVICDLMMPVMNGEELVQEVRKDSALSHIPILMFTAIDTQDSELNLLAAGADDYCAKTTKREILILRVKRLLARTSNPLQHYLKQ